MLESHMLSEVQVTVAFVAAPVSSTKPSAEELLAPPALFQLLMGTAPATSVLPMGVPRPTKSMLIALAVGREVTTFSVKLVDCVVEPLVPVTVTVELPSGVLVEAPSVSTEVPDALIELGLNDGVTPDGRPLMLKVTVPVN